MTYRCDMFFCFYVIIVAFEVFFISKFTLEEIYCPSFFTQGKDNEIKKVNEGSIEVEFYRKFYISGLLFNKVYEWLCSFFGFG